MCPALLVVVSCQEFLNTSFLSPKLPEFSHRTYSSSSDLCDPSVLALESPCMAHLLNSVLPQWQQFLLWERDSLANSFVINTAMVIRLFTACKEKCVCYIYNKSAVGLKTTNICHNRNHPLWSSAIPLIFYINHNYLGSVEKLIDGNHGTHFTSIFFHLQYFLFHSHFPSLSFARETDLAEGFNLWFSTGV